MKYLGLFLLLFGTLTCTAQVQDLSCVSAEESSFVQPFIKNKDKIERLPLAPLVRLAASSYHIDKEVYTTTLQELKKLLFKMPVTYSLLLTNATELNSLPPAVQADLNELMLCGKDSVFLNKLDSRCNPAIRTLNALQLIILLNADYGYRRHKKTILTAVQYAEFQQINPLLRAGLDEYVPKKSNCSFMHKVFNIY